MSSIKAENNTIGNLEQADLKNSLPLSQAKLLELFILFFVLSCVATSMLIFRFFQTGELKFFYLVWNLFLAWVPFGLSLVIYKLVQQPMKKEIKGIVVGGVGALWLLFFPNAPYMLTDFIHFRGIPFYVLDGGVSRFNSDLTVWFDFVINSLFIFIGALLGFLALYILHQLVRHYVGSLIGWSFVLGTLVISSFGIYLGRFIRWNSWDILNNFGPLIKSIFETIHYESIAFTLLYATLLLLGYFTLYQLVKIRT